MHPALRVREINSITQNRIIPSGALSHAHTHTSAGVHAHAIVLLTIGGRWKKKTYFFLSSCVQLLSSAQPQPPQQQQQSPLSHLARTRAAKVARRIAHSYTCNTRASTQPHSHTTTHTHTGHMQLLGIRWGAARRWCQSQMPDNSNKNNSYNVYCTQTSIKCTNN